MRFSVEFENEAGERRTIIAALSAEEVRSVDAVRALGKEGADYAQAYALQGAYREVPKGFLHTQPPELQR